MRKGEKRKTVNVGTWQGYGKRRVRRLREPSVKCGHESREILKQGSLKRNREPYLTSD
jgi:hypothetical protein